MKKHNRGFTLIELMIVIGIIGVLAAVGYPAYTNATKKANRADGINGLLALSGLMEEYYMNNDTYKTATIGNTKGNNKTSEGMYKLAIIQKDDFYYKIRAIPLNGDTECGNLFLDSTGRKTSQSGTGCW